MCVGSVFEILKKSSKNFLHSDAISKTINMNINDKSEVKTNNKCVKMKLKFHWHSLLHLKKLIEKSS
jgi:hypothetical protein